MGAVGVVKLTLGTPLAFLLIFAVVLLPNTLGVTVVAPVWGVTLLVLFSVVLLPTATPPKEFLIFSLNRPVLLRFCLLI